MSLYDPSKPLIEPLEAIVHSEIKLLGEGIFDAHEMIHGIGPGIKTLLVARDAMQRPPAKVWHIAPEEGRRKLLFTFDRYGNPPNYTKPRKYSLVQIHSTPMDYTILKLFPVAGFEDTNCKQTILVHHTNTSLKNSGIADCVSVLMEDYAAREQFFGYND